MSKVFLFDFDGVFVDTFRLCHSLSVEWDGISVTEEEYRAFFHGNIYQVDAADSVEAAQPVAADHPVFQKYTRGLMEHEVIAGMPSVLAAAAARSKVAVVTSSVNSAVHGFLEKHGLRRHVHDIYGADVHKSKVVKTRMALDRFGAEAGDAVFITDTLGDIREAAKAGVDAVAVTWGFHDEATLRQGNPRMIVHTPTDLLHALE